MIFNAKLDRLINTQYNSLLSFVIPLYQAKNIELEQDKEYKLEITEIKSKRSLRQNNLMWAIINRIAQKVGMTDNEVYCQIVEMANIKAIYIQTLPEVKKELEKVFRVVHEEQERISDKGVETMMFKCYYGTSKFDTKEMNDFIEQLLYYAHENEIDVREFEMYL